MESCQIIVKGKELLGVLILSIILSSVLAFEVEPPKELVDMIKMKSMITNEALLKSSIGPINDALKNVPGPMV